MSNDELISQLTYLREVAVADVEELQQKIVTRIEACHAVVAQTIMNAGREVCPKCQGTGKLERLDAAVMRKFGLQDWQGCNVCGGTMRCEGNGFTSPVAWSEIE